MSATPDSTLANPEQRIADLERRLAESRAERVEALRKLAETTSERDEALARETATTELLGIINSSPGDLAPVFDAMLEKAMRLCEAAFGGLWTFDRDQFMPAASHGVPAACAAFFAANTMLPGPGTAPYRFLRGGERSVIEDRDLVESEAYRAGDPARRALVDLGGARSALQVPLVKDDAVLGLITVYRQEVLPFTDKQIALLQNFAAQAAIAMENARLLTETREALEQQTATAEVLQVINGSPGDLPPVFDAMLEKALRLCGGSFGELRTYDGERFRLAATHGVPTAYVQHYSRNISGIYGPGTGPARILAGERVVHIPDLVATEPYRLGDPDRMALVELGGARAYLLVPLLKDTTVFGYIMIYRKEVGSFSEKQITLLQNFAAQAVIAMENARLLTETREALEQQTATAEVLGVINSSPGDLAPVFEAILEKAHSLCGATIGSLVSFDGEHLQALANRGMPADFEDFVRRPFLPDPNSFEERLIQEQRLIHVPDVQALGPLPDNPITRAAIRLGGIRTVLFVPLRKDNAAAGYIAAARGEVRPFADKEIALLQNFAAQAVIAMENARLLGELQARTRELEESLEYQLSLIHI